jgi:hypothetical protein
MTLRRVRPAPEEDAEALEDEKRRRDNIAAGRHPNFITFDDRAVKQRREARRKSSTTNTNNPSHMPDPRQQKKREDGWFPPDAMQVPADTPPIHYEEDAL